MKRFLSILLVVMMLVPMMALHSNAHTHSFTPWFETIEPTCTTAGERKRYCAGCQTIEIEVLAPYDHNWSDWITKRRPTASESGLKTRKCSRCKLVENEEILFESLDPMVVVYFNSTQWVSGYEFKNIDVLHLHPVQVTGSAGCDGSPFRSTVYSRISYIRKKAAEAQNPDMKVTLAIANGNLDVFESWLRTDEYRKQFAQHFAALARQYDIDGFEIDYEFPQNTNLRTEYVEFIRQLRIALDEVETEKNRELTISLAVPAGSWAFSLFDICGLEPYVDWFSIMNYDLYIGSNYNKITHHHTPPYDNVDNINYKIPAGGSVASDIALYQSYNIPNDKIVVGLGMYAHRWINVQSTTDGLFATGTMDNSNIHYSDLLSSYINKNGYVRYWDDTSKAPYLYNKDKREFITYDDEDSVAAKCDLVLDHGVRGVMVFDYCTCDGVGFFDKLGTFLRKGEVKHIWGVWKVVREADCVNMGQRMRTCSCGDVEYLDISALGHDYKSVVTAPTCTSSGYTTYTCSRCSNSYVDDYVTALGHNFGEWVTVTEATETTDGLNRRQCTQCDSFEEKVIPATGEVEPDADVYVTNYTLTFKNAANINAIRIASGNLTTSSEIKNAPDRIDINSKVIGANTDAKGNYNYGLPDGGIYSVWYKLNDGQQFIVSGLDNTEMTQTIDVYGVTLTVNNLYGVKDMFVAKGTYSTYRDIKNAEGNFSISANKIDGAHSYKYPAAVGEPGEYTICIRYDDSSRENTILHFNCEVETPTIDVFGKNITIGNIDDIKVIRIAPGIENSVKEIKATEGSLGYSASTIAKLGFTDSLTINNKADENGADTVYTVYIEYNNLYSELHHITLNKLMPEYTVNGNSITLTNLEGLSLLRYAPGSFDTAAGIKGAAGSRYLNSAENGAVTLNGLTGKYTFLVQYEENSKNIFTVDFSK